MTKTRQSLPRAYIGAANAVKKGRAIGVQIRAWIDRTCPHPVVIRYEGRLEYGDPGTKKWWYGETFGTLTIYPGQVGTSINLIQVAPAPSSTGPGKILSGHQLYVVQMMNVSGAYPGVTLGHAIIKSDTPPLYVIYGPNVDGVYALEPNPDVTPTGVGDFVMQAGDWRLYKYALPGKALALEGSVCTADDKGDYVSMFRQEEDGRWTVAERGGIAITPLDKNSQDKVQYVDREVVNATWYVGKDLYALYYDYGYSTEVSYGFSIDLLKNGKGGTSFVGTRGVEDLSNGTALSSTGKTYTFDGIEGYDDGGEWLHEHVGGYVTLSDGKAFITLDSADELPSSTYNVDTTNTDKKTTADIADWVHNNLLENGWSTVGGAVTGSVLDVVRAYREKDSTSHQFEIGNRITVTAPGVNAITAYNQAIDLAKNEFGVTFKSIAECDVPAGPPSVACEEENQPPGPYGVGQLHFIAGFRWLYDFPIIDPFTRTTTEEATYSEELTNGYMQFGRSGAPQLITSTRYSADNFSGTLQYPWEEVLSSEYTHHTEESSDVGSAQLSTFVSDGDIKTGPWASETWSYLYPFEVFEYRKQDNNTDETSPVILGGVAIPNAQLISSVTADLTGLVSGRDEGYEYANRVYGYRSETGETTDLTSIFSAISTGDGFDNLANGPIVALRGTDVPVG